MKLALTLKQIFSNTTGSVLLRCRFVYIYLWWLKGIGSVLNRKYFCTGCILNFNT